MSRLHTLADQAQTRLPDAWRRYVPAILLVAAAIGARALLSPSMGPPSAIIFLVAIIASAWIGGVGPALLTSVALHIAHGYLFIDPPGLWESNIASLVSTVGYYVVGIIVGVLSQKRASALARARAEHADAVAQRERLRATLGCIADGVIVTNVTGHLELMNRAAEAATGWSIVRANGRPCDEVFTIRREDGKEGVENPIDRALQHECVVHETAPLVLISKSNGTIPISYSAAPISDADGRVSGVVLIFRDESQRRGAELALKETDRRKDEFLATLAHELRNPLAPIATGVELLKVAQSDSQKIEEIRLIMQRQTQHMVHLIDDLLDVSRITRGRLDLRKEVVDLAEIIRDAVEATRPLFDAAGHELSVTVSVRPLRLHADATRLTQVFSNLLNNAAKFTPRHGHVNLHVELVGDEAVITVADAGIGIPEDRLAHVFELFAQIHDRSEFGGGGLESGLRS